MMKYLTRLLMVLLVAGLSLAVSSGPDSQVNDIYIDAHGVKWIATNMGLFRFDGIKWESYSLASHVPHRKVNALAYEQSTYGDVLWVATEGGVSVLSFDADGVTGSTSYFAESGLLDNNVSDIAVDSRGGKFFGSEKGVTWFHNGIMDSILFADFYLSMYSTPIRKIEIFGDTLYLAQDGSIGRLVTDVDGVTGASRWGEGPYPSYGVSPYSVDIRSIMVKGEEIQYFGTDVGVETHTGYYAKSGWDLVSDEEGLVNNNVVSIAEAPDGAMWFGTLGGVSSLKEGSWTNYTLADGLAGNEVHAIAFDPDGSIWLGTDGGLSKLTNAGFENFLTAKIEKELNTPDIRLQYLPQHRELVAHMRVVQAGDMSMDIYTIDGKLMGRELFNLHEGQQSVRMSTGQLNLAAGIYVVRLQLPDGLMSGKIWITP